METAMQHLDAFDPRRGDLFADAECRDCAHANVGNPNKESCLATKQVRSVVAALLSELDVQIPLLTFEPDFDARGNLCPGFYPSEAYMEELEQREAEGWATWRENMDRLAATGRRAA